MLQLSGQQCLLEFREINLKNPGESRRIEHAWTLRVCQEDLLSGRRNVGGSISKFLKEDDW